MDRTNPSARVPANHVVATSSGLQGRTAPSTSMRVFLVHSSWQARACRTLMAGPLEVVFGAFPMRPPLAAWRNVGKWRLSSLALAREAPYSRARPLVFLAGSLAMLCCAAVCSVSTNEDARQVRHQAPARPRGELHPFTLERVQMSGGRSQATSFVPTVWWF